MLPHLRRLPLYVQQACVQASFNQCSILESQGLKLSKLLMVLLQPYVEEVLEMNVRRARSMLLNFEGNDDILPPQIVSAPPGLTTSSSDSMQADSGTRFIFLIKDTMQQLTSEVISHFGAIVLTKISHFFDEYVEILIKALPGPSEDENLAENKEHGFEASDIDDEHITLNDEIILDSDNTDSCVLSIKSSDSFASANMGEVESLNYFTDPEA
ncbi:hypothetical protein GIB67_037915 [Kingdonia uniflora]|uniref:Uncharacterized protein n=1 Tax=Kingdonia uniflora TaxID=39325 RepID=A0A7J7LH37_9MAGN|nr:hypothetical protein GIB67_037915 [Kingdonia uniflora]